ncbi:hypothetical protein AWB78_08275 [Caballeronia calidae]|uniref:Uncharacterized protein n=1 Tax=Caballeronia calidae TaxID=1777139 RepID=A0A158EIV5_9BURK|nr:hypothetical protein AWB78_08275 [Caballeronia calidae]
MLRSIGSPGMGGCAIWPQPVQIRLRRIVRMTLNIAVTRASCSDTSSPSSSMVLSHFGQMESGSSTRSSRGRWGGSASFADAADAPELDARARARRTSVTPLPAARSSSWVSSRSICRSTCSDLRPKCMRLSLSICAFRRSSSWSRSTISRSRSAISWRIFAIDACCSSTRAWSSATVCGSGAWSGMRCSLRAFDAVYNIDNAAVRRGCRQSMPSSNIDSCADVR